MRFILPLCLLLASCGEKRTTVEDFNVVELTLPGGQLIKAEPRIKQEDMLQGMMFRTSLAPDRGMLYLYKTPGHYRLWMYQTPLKLDMIWMDASHRIVEIVENAPPCETAASKCPQYGGNEAARYALQMAGGMVQRYHLSKGQVIQW